MTVTKMSISSPSLVNSLLGLLVFPVEKEKAFFNSFYAAKLPSHPSSSDLSGALPGFPDLPSLKITQFNNCRSLGRFLKRLRNAVSHRRLDFSSESHDLAVVNIAFSDAPVGSSVVDWEVSMSAADLRTLCLYIVSEVITRHL